MELNVVSFFQKIVEVFSTRISTKLYAPFNPNKFVLKRGFNKSQLIILAPTISPYGEQKKAYFASNEKL